MTWNRWILNVSLALLLTAGCSSPDGGTAPSGEASGTAPSASDPTADAFLLTSNRDGNSEIYRVQGNDWTNLTRHQAEDNWPVPSPDGTRIAFQSRRSGNLDVWVMDADGSNPTQLTHDSAADYLPSWSPDGSRITFTSMRAEEGDEPTAKHIYIMNADGSNQRRWIQEPLGTSAGAEWSPDGKAVLFSRAQVEARGAQVWIRDVETGEETQLTQGDLYHGSATFSPDGSRIAFYSNAGDLSRIIVMNRDGSDPTPLTGKGQYWYPRWSPDGKWLVVTATIDPISPHGEPTLDLMAIPVAGGEPVKLIEGRDRKTEGSWLR